MKSAQIVIKSPKDTMGNVNLIVGQLIPKWQNEVTDIAKQFEPYKKNRKELCKRLWDYCKSTYQYKLDPDGAELIRSPKRSFQDRNEGIDCEDFTVLLSCILLVLKVNHLIRVADFGSGWQHIYLVVDGIVLDPVQPTFNYEDDYYRVADFEMSPNSGLGSKKISYYTLEKNFVINPLENIFFQAAIKNPTPQKIHELSKFLAQNQEASIMLYHGTSSKHPIESQGIKPTNHHSKRYHHSQNGYVYLTIFPKVAQGYAKLAYPKETTQLYQVILPVKSLVPDPNNVSHLLQKSLASSLTQRAFSACVKEEIQPPQVSNFNPSLSLGSTNIFDVLKVHEENIGKLILQITDDGAKYIWEVVGIKANYELEDFDTDYYLYNPIKGLDSHPHIHIKKIDHEFGIGYYWLNRKYEPDNFVLAICKELIEGKTHKRASLESYAKSEFGIYDAREVKELTEHAIVLVAERIASQNLPIEQKFQQMVSFYERQINLSLRTTTSILLQQYSTPTPIGYLMGIYCGIQDFDILNNKVAFEPSAGNGVLLVATHPKFAEVNEIDGLRRANLESNEFSQVTAHNAAQSELYGPSKERLKKYDAVLTNPPFGRIDPTEYKGFTIKDLDHLMAIRALECMKDDGKAAIIFGGHTQYDEKGRIELPKDRYFLNYLYANYNVEDVMNIDGNLYARMGVKANIRIVLINGRKPVMGGNAPIKSMTDSSTVKTFDELYNRFNLYVSMNTDSKTVNGVTFTTHNSIKWYAGQGIYVVKTGSRWEIIDTNRSFGSENNLDEAMKRAAKLSKDALQRNLDYDLRKNNLSKSANQDLKTLLRIRGQIQKKL